MSIDLSAFDYDDGDVSNEVIEQPLSNNTPEEKKKPGLDVFDHNEYVRKEEHDLPPLPETQEASTIRTFAKGFIEDNGWEWSEDLLKGDDVENLYDLINDIIEDHSQPEYADPIVEEFDSYVKRGGDPKQFLETMYGNTSGYGVSERDLQTEEGQADILATHYKLTTRWTDDKIAKEINRLYTLGELESEAQEALQHIKYFEQQEAQEERQRLQQELQEQEQEHQKRTQELINYVHNANEQHLGVEMTRRQKEQFLEYILAIDPNTGLTAYGNYIQNNPQAELKLAALAFTGVTEGKLPTSTKNKVVKDIQQKLRSNPVKFGGSSVNVRYGKGDEPGDYSAFDY